MVQVRLPKKDVPHVIYDIVHSRTSWDDVTSKYPVVQVDDGEGGGAAAAPEEAKNTKVVTNSRGSFTRPA